MAKEREVEVKEELFDDEAEEVTPAAPAAAEQFAGLTQEQLIQLLLNQTMMAQAMSKIADASEDGPIRQMSAAKAKFRTPWNPEGKKRGTRIYLTRASYLNGHRLREMMMSEDEINMFNSLKAGVYNGKRWTVQVKEAEGEGSGSEVLVWIPNKTQDDRIKMAIDCVHPSDPKKNGIIALLEIIVREQSAVRLA